MRRHRPEQLEAVHHGTKRTGGRRCEGRRDVIRDLDDVGFDRDVVVLGATAQQIREEVRLLAPKTPGIRAERRLVGDGAVVAVAAPWVCHEYAVARVQGLAE